MTVYELHPEPGFTTDVFDRDAPPVLAVDPGDTVVSSTHCHAWRSTWIAHPPGYSNICSS